MPRFSDLRQSKYLSQQDVDPPVLVTITGYEEVDFAKEGEEPQPKWVIKFRELEKGMTLGSENNSLITAIIGTDDLDEWKGAKIVLYREPTVKYKGKITGGIRVRAPKQKTQSKPIPPPPETEPEWDPAAPPDSEVQF